MFWDHRAAKNAQPPYQRMDARKSYVYYYTGVSLSGAQFGCCVFTRVSATANSMLLTFDFDFPYIWEMNVWAVEWARFIFIAQFTRIFHFNLMVLSRILAERARQKDTLWMEFMCKNYQSLEDLLPPRGCFVYFYSDSLSLLFLAPFQHSFSFIGCVYVFILIRSSVDMLLRVIFHPRVLFSVTSDLRFVHIHNKSKCTLSKFIWYLSPPFLSHSYPFSTSFHCIFVHVNSHNYMHVCQCDAASVSVKFIFIYVQLCLLIVWNGKIR